MCGIAGIVHLEPMATPPSKAALEVMCGALTHRGPDEFGWYRDTLAGLAHSRLSIIDLATGQQPLSNEDETLWIAFNGEIFNYLELRGELASRGHDFRTRSDTEVIVHAWEEWGEAAIPRFNGQWAFALWDSRNHELVLSRDRVGILPLYYADRGQRILFASEVKAIFAADPSMPRAFDPYGLQQTFTFWSIVPPQSVFQGVRELEPGHVRRYKGSAVSDRPYWQPRFPRAEDSKAERHLLEYMEAVFQGLHQATKLRMLRSDVPVGCYLSGGLDSSLVSALGREAVGKSFHTFSIRFEDAEYDETRFQRCMVEQLGTEHHDIVVSKQDIADAFPEVIWHTERPILRTAPTPLFLLSGLVRRTGIKVVLTGEGSDEFFGGYDLYREGVLRRFWAQHPDSKLRARLFFQLYPYLARSPVSQQAMAEHFFGRNLERYREPGFAHDTRWHTTRALTRLFTAELREQAKGRDPVQDLCGTLPEPFSSWSPLAQDQYLEIRTLLAGYLLSSQGDRMLMAHSVEGRFPFLDPEVIDLANSLPDACKISGTEEKHLLKQLSKAILPAEIVQRVKQPYRAPDALSFVGEDVPGWIDEVLSPEQVKQCGVFDPQQVVRLREKCGKNKEQGQLSNTDNMALVGVLSTQLLNQRFIRSCPQAEPPKQIQTQIDRVPP